MEAVLVDTDVFSFLWQDRPEAAPYRPLVADRIVVLSFTSVAEAHYGARKRRWGERRMAELEAATVSSPLRTGHRARQAMDGEDRRRHHLGAGDIPAWLVSPAPP